MRINCTIKDRDAIMLEVFYSIRLKPYLLSLLLSRKQTQIQSWKVLIVFEEPGGRYSIIRSEVLLQLMILFKRYPQTRMRGALSWKIVAALTVGWGGRIKSAQPEADGYHLLCRRCHRLHLESVKRYRCSQVGKRRCSHSQTASK